MLRKVLSCGWYMHFIQIRNSEMKFVLIILFSTCACCMQAQVNLIQNGGFEETTSDTCEYGPFYHYLLSYKILV
jgi:hypothetical protein